MDGYCGILVALFIFYTGVSAAKETLDPLLGKPPEEGFGSMICLSMAMCQAGRILSLHAEASAKGDALGLHDIIGHAGMELRQKLSCQAVIHTDPTVTNGANLIFGIVAPYKYAISDESLICQLQKHAWENLGEGYFWPPRRIKNTKTRKTAIDRKE